MFLLKIVNKNPRFILMIIMLGIINSSFYSLLLICINRGIAHNNHVVTGLKFNGYWFFGLVVVSFFLRKTFQKYMVVLTNAMLFDFEISIIEKIRQAEFEKFIGWDKTKVYTAMGDIKVIAQLPRLFVDFINTGIIILVSLTYLLFVSSIDALIILSFSAVLMLVFIYRQKKAVKLIQQARDLENKFYLYLEDLLSGYKEIKMSQNRSSNILDKYLSVNRSSARDLEKKAAVVYMENELLSSYGWFIILGLIVFVLPNIHLLSNYVTTSFIVIILYLLGPLSTLISTFPFVTKVRVSLKRLESFHDDLCNDFSQPGEGNQTVLTDDFNDLTFQTISYHYQSINGRPAFKLGPVSLSIKKGEIVFITGNNGSGKSTFLHLLTGLLHPTHGAITFNEQLLTKINIQSYRDRFSAIFIESFLFNENYNDFDIRVPGEGTLEKFALLGMDQAVVHGSRINGKNLSKGQQKRLALIFALMEEKEILVLDEWAAEQDPYFRQNFYEVILKTLQGMGKTIIAVTHDDKYFHCADRVINFENGLITTKQNPDPVLYEYE